MMLGSANFSANFHLCKLQTHLGTWKKLVGIFLGRQHSKTFVAAVAAAVVPVVAAAAVDSDDLLRN